MPQALMLTAIVVGVCVSALALTLAYRLYRHFGTLDIDEIKRRIGHE
ncbi:MAG TPA: NADH-quinone oxidoreductase subunit K [Spirochaetia bacterium]|nr:NADH-quinone oxidoreductase subunit K [Spirochaetia bacterium]